MLLRSSLPRLSLLSVVLTGACVASGGPTNHRHLPGTLAGAVQAASEARLLQASCGLADTDAAAAGAARPLSNNDYLRTVHELVPAVDQATLALPPESVGAGFDTSPAAHAVTPTVAQAFLAAAQQLAGTFTSGSTCAATQFAPSCTGPALAAFAEQAFRRPLLSAEQQRLLALQTNLAQAGAAPQVAFAGAATAVLMAPQFLYRSRLSAQAGLGNADQYALASTLSYALWSTKPDSSLLALAGAGQLRSSLLASEVVRLVEDAKAADFLANFVGQWLGLKGLPAAPAAASLPPAMVAAMSAKTQAFVAALLASNGNIKHLLDPAGADNVSAPSDGLLAQEAFLVQTASADRTAPVKRGKWIMDNLLCSSPPPPPTDQAASFGATDTSLPVRQRLAKHREQPACAGCHQVMDPLGLAFENYDQTGHWRGSDTFGPIDASGSLPDGTTFRSARDLTLQLQKQEAFPRCFTTKLATYALGRPPTSQETCVINKLAEKTQDESYGLRSLLIDLSLSLLAR